MNDDYYCVLSGLAPQSIGTDEGDEFEDLPNGWIKMTIQRRFENPQWKLIQAIKQESLNQMLAQVPTEDHSTVTEAIMLQIDAQWVALEDKVGQYVVTEETRYIADPLENSDVLEECKPLFETLELDFEDLGVEQSENDDKIEVQTEPLPDAEVGV